MNRTGVLLTCLAIAAATAPSSANATITFTIANVPQLGQQSIVFADQGPATTIVGNGSLPNTLTLSGSTTTGNQLIATGGLVEAPSGDIQTLMITPSSLLDALILDPTAGTGTINYAVTDDQSNIFTFSTSLGAGNNFLTITGSNGEHIQNVAISTSDGFRAIGSFAAVFSSAVPEPATWMLMLLGFAASGIAARSSRRVRSEAA